MLGCNLCARMLYVLIVSLCAWAQGGSQLDPFARTATNRLDVDAFK